MKNLLYIGNKLSSHGFSVTTIETLGPLLEAEGFVVQYASDKRNKILRMLDMIRMLILNRNSTDCVLIDTYSTSNFWFAFAVSQIARFFKLQYIPILHGGNLPKKIKDWKKTSSMIFKNSLLNIAPSHYLLDAFLKEGYSNTAYIPNAIEMGQYKFIERKNSEPKLLWVRSFASIYNPKMAVDVLKILKKHFPEATLCMVGPDKDGSLDDTKNYAKSLGLAVEFTGKLSKKEWIARSENYAVFINTTHFDNMPVSVIEAMALGFPVVSTNVGGLSLLLENKKDALLVDDSDSEAMADALLYLFHNPEISSELSLNARSKAITFDWNNVKKMWKEILK